MDARKHLSLNQIAQQSAKSNVKAVIIIDDSPSHLRLNRASAEPKLEVGSQTLKGLTVEYIVLEYQASIGSKRAIREATSPRKLTKGSRK